MDHEVEMLKALASILLILGSLTFAQSAQARSHYRHHPQYSSAHHRLHQSHHARRMYHPRHRLAHHQRSMHVRRSLRAQQVSSMAEGAGQERLVSVALRHMGSRNFTGRRGPWCGFAMNAFAREAGMPTIGSGRAIDWRTYGRPSGARAGAIAVFRHHVGIVTGIIGNKLQIISGNHGGRVGVGLYSMSRVVAYRS
jgi:hypothetical protein